MTQPIAAGSTHQHAACKRLAHAALLLRCCCPRPHLQLLLLLAVQPCNGADGGSVQARVAQLQAPQLSRGLTLTQLLVLQLVLQQGLHHTQAATRVA
jgi:hypothetical protein